MGLAVASQCPFQLQSIIWTVGICWKSAIDSHYLQRSSNVMIKLTLVGFQRSIKCQWIAGEDQRDALKSVFYSIGSWKL